ncbi:MAG: GTPase HflX [Chlorobium sp.]|uniref:GTPase HflX n=1 Tax=Chlorobium sp. TaxID=1095 RepID=UPI0025C488DB|nr:GTPase HflX [Chlorobium sp.]MCF8216390.1 GTPase HflX [Chlorobium sp.]MCF8271293.1 GTPase HflX [Chlorobium sp.]MCF8287667.1 GTPase HflX [Chlorobium sp.]MCF8291206.1 GTPase HflX [Chlorobium sp.]MCF8385301.1 GTPase HflX [Chlorobium sp.]
MNTFFVDQPRERAVLVGICSPPEVTREQVEEYLSELFFLADTAGADVLSSIIQERRQPDPGTYIGKGKVDELAGFIRDEQVDIVIVDDDLSPVQARNLERAFECKVIDRTGLILQIFALRAQSARAKMQVELAQLEYMLPRLTGQWTHLSKQKGGIGTKGPGETQIETDRRLVRNRISWLKKKLREDTQQHDTQTRGRRSIPGVALVGYTNAGKSTLMNALCPEAGAFAENRLFATLDTKTRRLELKINKLVLLSDTVGFIRKLPHKLVESFRSTLEEVLQADFLLHVIDVSHHGFEEQMQVVRQTLKDIGVEHENIIEVFNKLDALEDPDILRDLRLRYPEAVFISAARGINLSALKEAVSDHLTRDFRERKLRIHVSNYKLIGYLYDHAEVMGKQYLDEEIELTFRVHKNLLKHVDALINASEHSMYASADF